MEVEPSWLSLLLPKLSGVLLIFHQLNLCEKHVWKNLLKSVHVLKSFCNISVSPISRIKVVLHVCY